MEKSLRARLLEYCEELLRMNEEKEAKQVATVRNTKSSTDDSYLHAGSCFNNIFADPFCEIETIQNCGDLNENPFKSASKPLEKSFYQQWAEDSLLREKRFSRLDSSELEMLDEGEEDTSQEGRLDYGDDRQQESGDSAA